MIIDRLYERVAEVGPICVGLDTHLDYIPQDIKKQNCKISEQIFSFNKVIIEATKDLTAIYKLQISYYESQGIEGMIAYKKTLDYLRKNNILSIGDIKRGDISDTAVQYAKGHFEGDFETDFITLNPYMGFDSITPYLDYLEKGDKGIFVLLRTSNPGAKDIEYLNYCDEPLYYYIGDRLEKIGKNYIGKYGYSSLGLVVGGTHKEEVETIRKRYRNSYFLIPGYGAQGGDAEEIKKYFIEENGAIVNSSRGIIKKHMNYPDGDKKLSYYARKAVIEMRKDLYEKPRI